MSAADLIEGPDDVAVVVGNVKVPATVDDMVEWAHRRGFQVVMASFLGHEVPCHASIGRPLDDGSPEYHGEGQTIREALIAAVRRVAAAEVTP